MSSDITSIDMSDEEVVDMIDGSDGLEESPEKLSQQSIETITLDDDDDVVLEDMSDDCEIIEELSSSSSNEAIVCSELNGQSCVETKDEGNSEAENGIKFEDKVSESVSKSPTKRLTPTTLPLPSTSNGAPKSGPSSPKVMRVSAPIECVVNGVSTLDPKTIFDHYMQTFRDSMTAANADQKEIDEYMDVLNELFPKIEAIPTNRSFLDGNQYRKLMNTFTKEVSDMTAVQRIVSHYDELVQELKRFTRKPPKDIPKVKSKKKAVQDLTDSLKRLRKQICLAETEELGYDDLDGRTGWTDLPKLYRKAEEVWAKREELLKRSTNSGRSMFRKFTYDSTTYPEVNQFVEKLFNAHLKKLRKGKTKRRYVDETFTFTDVRKAILDEMQSKQIVVMNSDSMIANIYKDLLSELRERRKREAEEGFESMETYEDLKPETFVAEDPQIEIECAKNKSHFDRKLQELIDKYASDDIKKNGPTLLVEGSAEWDNDLTGDGDFESLDVKEGELDGENEDEDKSDEDAEPYEDSSLPDFSATTPLNSQPVPSAEENTAISESTGAEDTPSDVPIV
ncbi:unnamed protein product [Oppiella nova]|uniref:Uncharacterized protein n=1 Tax=Oppiella nova TaxID=334625 RepID=A0A7R9QMY4_9ACAR|nr:unnamed protein product [Oppiella nova]CAG2169160.1 unnamed protein product [Oppiella nova]